MYPTPFSTDEIISSVYILKRDVVEKLACGPGKSDQMVGDLEIWRLKGVCSGLCN